MKTKGLLLIVGILLLCIVSVCGQNAIQEKIDLNEVTMEQAALFAPLVEIAENQSVSHEIPEGLINEKQIFQIQKQELKDIRTNKNKYLRLNITIAGEDKELHLMKAEIFTPDFRLELASAPGVELHRDRGVHYWGTLADTPKSLVAISFFEEEISGFIAVDNQHFTLGKVEQSDHHILYKKNDFNEGFSFECQAIPEDNPIQIQAGSVEQSALAGCVRIHIEADYSFYLDKGSSTTATANYITAIFSQAAILYANENINTDISLLRIWDVASPYGQSDPLTDLNNQGYGRTNGDLVHLIHTFYTAGVAYVNALCRTTTNTGVSGIRGSYSNVPTFSWDVDVLTHELGHNLGSPHTHDCVWNGNSTQIDDCGNKYLAEDNDPDTRPEPCYNANNEILPSAGTIMSYCHLIGGIGVNFNNGFGQQPGNLIRSRVNSASCLGNCQCNDGIQNGNETDVDCGGDCPPCATCDDGILNGDEIGIDCGGSCSACPPEDCSTFDFNSGVVSFAPNDQDFGTYIVQGGGTTLFIKGNVWKAVEINYAFSPNTVIEFDFKSTSQGEIHELSFDNDLTLPTTNRIVVYGDQGYAGDYNNAPYSGSGDYEHYTIKLGFSGIFKYLVLTGDDDADATANSYFRNIKIYEDYNSNMQCGASHELDICVNLEGAYDLLAGELTNTLETLDMLPANQPYNQAPWNYNGTEINNTSNVVDWLLVSFRIGITKNTEVAKTAALLKTDGCIYFPDDAMLPSGFNTPVRIVIEHRNHLGVMSPQPVNFNGKELSFDFRKRQSYKGVASSGQKRLINGTWCMYVGEMEHTQGYDINGADKGIWSNDNGKFGEYLPSDLNQDGDVNGKDKTIWSFNNGTYSSVPR